MRDIDTEEQARVTDDPSGIGKRLVLNLPISGKDTRLPVVAARPPAPVLQAATTVRSPKKRGSAGAADAALADMAVGCALGWLEFRFPEIDWRTAHPNLGRLLDKLMQRPSFADTRPG